MPTHRLVLIDGMPVLYRSFYAIRDLSTSDGRPTNAVYGFARFLEQVRELWKPTHWAVVFDGGLPEARVAMLEDYKAQREPMPDPLREQIDVAQDFLDKSSIPWTIAEGEEADDVIATLAERNRSNCDQAYIASSDKDFFQLVDDKIHMIPISGAKKGVSIGPEQVIEKTGVAPNQIVDWLSLVGDSADNIPGVPGVGPKTAAKLVSEYGSLKGMKCQIDRIQRERIRNALKENWDDVLRNTDMIRLKRDLECTMIWEEMAVRAPDPSELLPLLESLEFDSMARSIREPELL